MPIVVNDTTPRNQYTASGGQTVFAYSFEIFAVGDIKVYQGSTLLSYAASPSDKTEYSVSGAGTSGGGNVTLGGGATAGTGLAALGGPMGMAAGMLLGSLFD